MPEGFNSIEDLRVAITASTAPLELGLSSARQHIAQFSEWSGRDLKKFDGAIEALGSRIQWVQGRLLFWVSAIQQANEAWQSFAAKADKWAEENGRQEEWNALKGAVENVKNAIGTGLVAAYEGAQETMRKYAEEGIPKATSAMELQTVKTEDAIKKYTNLTADFINTWADVFYTLQSPASRPDDYWKREVETWTDYLKRTQSDLIKLAENPAAEDMITRLLGLGNRSQIEMDKKRAEFELWLAQMMLSISALGKVPEEEAKPEEKDPAEKIVTGLEREVRAMQQKAEAQRMLAGPAAAYLAEMRARNQAEDQGIEISEKATASFKRLAGTIGALAQAEADRRKTEQDSKAFERILDGLDKQIAQIEKQTLAMVQGTAVAARMVAEERALAEAKSRGLNLTTEQIERIRVFATEASAATERLERLRSTMALVKESGELVSRSLASAFDKWMSGTEVRGREMVANLLKDFAKLTFASTVLKPAQEWMTAGLGSFLGDQGKNSNGDLFGGLLGGLFGSQAASGWQTSVIPAFAAGGYAEGGKPAIVGEVGRELFIPRTSGSVVSNEQVREALGSGENRRPVSLTVNINAQGATVDAVAMLRNEIPSMVLSTVTDARERGLMS